MAQCGAKPVLLLVDEAHTLDLTVARVLLNSSQILREEVPFALVLAGSPHLLPHLAETATSFWARLDEGDLTLGLLSQEEAQDALREPFEQSDEGFQCEAEAIRSMAEQSDGHPYFVQIWGAEAEVEARLHHKRRVTMDVVEAVSGSVQSMRQKFYMGRWAELRKAGLLDPVARLAPELLDGRTLEHADAQALAAPQAPMEQGAAAVEKMLMLGVLQTTAEDALTAGIPSFMRFAHELAVEKANTVSAPHCPSRRQGQARKG